MKKIIYLLLLQLMICLPGMAQKKWYSFSKNDIATMSCEMGAGYLQGWREEVIYHPNALFEHFPKLNANFWDNRISWQRGNIKDANHILKFGVTAFHLTAVVIKTGDLKSYKGARKILKIIGDIAKNYAAYQLGFFLSYNVTHHNKLF